MTEPAPPLMPRHTRAVIIGAGRAGLAMAYALLRKGLKPQHDFVLIDVGDVAAALDREPSATPTVRQAALPGIRPPGNQKHHMSVEEVVSYLDAYASQLGLKPVWETRITAIHVDPHGHGLHLATDRGEIATRNVIITDNSPDERTGDGRSWVNRLKADQTISQIPGMFAITGGNVARLRSLRSETARAARTIAGRP